VHLTRINLAAIYNKLAGVPATVGNLIQPVVLLLIRGWWGRSFFPTGKGKLMNLDRTTAFFA